MLGFVTTNPTFWFVYTFNFGFNLSFLGQTVFHTIVLLRRDLEFYIFKII